MTAYYNEIDPYAAEWLHNLIAAGEIAPGDVDERSIEEVSGDDLKGYTQCHFFAGIGGWSYALRLAGWNDDRPVWSGSCPCQSLSIAGKRKGHADQRHLWPAFHRLIAERGPATIFGEQVSGSLGRECFAGVRADLEQSGYACGCVDIPAASVGAPHIRQRLWWVADDQRERSQAAESVTGTYGSVSREAVPEDAGRGIGLADAECPERRALDHTRQDAGFDGLPQGQEGASRIGSGGEDGWLDDTAESRRSGPLRTERWDAEQSREGVGTAQAGSHAEPRRRGNAGGLGDAAVSGLQDERCEQGAGSEGRFRQLGSPSGNGFWDAASWIPCGDGKARRVEPGIPPLAHGATARVGRLRAYGNAIVPQVAAEFIRAFEKVRPNNHG